MTIQIEIKDDQIEDLVEFYSIKQRSLKDQISKLEKNLRDVSATISQLKHLATMPRTSKANFLEETDIFSPKWPWIKKIAFAIKEAGKPISTREIVEILSVYEQRTEEEKKTAISSVSSTLSVKSGKHSDKREFVKDVNSSGEYVYNIWRENSKIDSCEYDAKYYGSNIVIDDLPF